MEITSGGTPGPSLADDLAGLDNNVYGLLWDCPEVQRLAESFADAGWRARSSSLTAFEIEQDWVRVELLQMPNGVMFNGVVEPSRVDELAAAFTGGSARYSIELWDPDGTEILRELAN